jgi:hypothetical protein
MLNNYYYLTEFYRIALEAILLLSLVLTLRGIRERWKSMSLCAVDRQAIAVSSLLCLTIVIPESINGSAYFPERLWAILWLLMVAGISGSILSCRMKFCLTMLSLVMSVFTLCDAPIAFYPISRTLAEIDSVVLPAAKRGLLLDSDSAGRPEYGLAFSTYYWSGARSFEHSNAVLLNSPWMGITISPLKPARESDLILGPASRSGNEPPTESYVEHPDDMRNKMSTDPAFRRLMLRKADFIFYIDPGGDGQSLPGTINGVLQDERDQWSCQSGRVYALCQEGK